MYAHWAVAQTIKAMTAWAVIPLEVSAEFWNTWAEVYRG